VIQIMSSFFYYFMLFQAFHDPVQYRYLNIPPNRVLKWPGSSQLIVDCCARACEDRLDIDIDTAHLSLENLAGVSIFGGLGLSPFKSQGRSRVEYYQRASGRCVARDVDQLDHSISCVSPPKYGHDAT